MGSRTALVEDLMERFPHVPREAVFKEDLLRGGVAFDASALSDNEGGEVKPKSYFIFSFDHGGSQTSSTVAVRTSGIDSIFCSTSPGSDPATGHPGAVRVIFT